MEDSYARHASLKYRTAAGRKGTLLRCCERRQIYGSARSVRARGFPPPPFVGARAEDSARAPKPVTALEAVASSAVKACLDMGACAMVVFAQTMLPAALLSKYKPPVPIVVVTTNHRVAAQCNVVSSLVPMYLPEMGTSDETLPMVLNTIRKLGIAALETGADGAGTIANVPGVAADTTSTALDLAAESCCSPREVRAPRPHAPELAR